MSQINIRPQKYEADVIIIGGGLAGITAAADLIERGAKVLLLDRDKPQRFGGLAKESFGGIMIVDTPEQRRLGIKDSAEIALQDWLRYAEFSKNDYWPEKWAEVYVNTSLETIYHWLKKRKVDFLPLPNWPERGLLQKGNSLPRWHIVWGTGHELVACVVRQIQACAHADHLSLKFEHAVSGLSTKAGEINGCFGIIENTAEPFEAVADLVIIATGGICGGDLAKVRENWPAERGKAPDRLLNGSHRYADGGMHDVVGQHGGKITHLDKQWHYAAGIPHPNPDRPHHGLSLLPPRSALWVNALGQRIGPRPLQGYTDTSYLVEEICKQPGQYSWQILNKKIALKELAVSGAEYMSAFKNKKKLRLIRNLIFGNHQLYNRLVKEAGDMLIANDLDSLVQKMNALEESHQVDCQTLKNEVSAFDAEIDKGAAGVTDEQLRRIVEVRKYKADRLRTCNLQKINDPKAGPLVAFREFILTRKSLGGIQTDLQCRVLDYQGEPIPGLFAVGEAAGFGGGGIHGKRSLEGTFLGGCILTGRAAARSIIQHT